MSGTALAFLDQFWDGGRGAFVNDTSGVRRTYVSRDYPAEQSWSDLAALYQTNAEARIRAGGGTTDNGAYRIAAQNVPVPDTVEPARLYAHQAQADEQRVSAYCTEDMGSGGTKTLGRTWAHWPTVRLTDVPVASGQATAGIYSKAGGGQWAAVDDVECFRESTSG